MHYFDNYRLLKQCYFDEKYSEFVPREKYRTREWRHKLEKVD